MLLSFLSYGGVASCALGGLLALVGLAKGRQARQLGAAVPVDSLSDLKQLWALVPILVAVTGRVLAPKPYACEMSETEAAIVETREEKRSERRAGGGETWVADSQLLRESMRETEWALADGSRVQLPVEGGRHADGDYLQMSGDQLIPAAQRHFTGRLAEEVLGARVLGVRQVERCLPVGTMLTAVGELNVAVEHPSAFKGAVRRGGKMLVLRPPRDGPFVLSRQPLPELIASLQATSVACQQWATVFTAVGATMLVAAATQHAATWLRQRSIRRRVEKALRERRAAAAAGGGAEAGAAQAAAAAGAGGLPGAAAPAGAAPAAGHDGGGDTGGALAGGLCVVCLEHAPDMVFPGCGHLCACSGCGSGLARCPICRSRSRPIRVYTP
ncbi:hypothetical protein ABPG75_009080 [Micractinium tetrahymenae]